MHPSIERHRAAIEDLCRRYGVTMLDVFGSATREDFDEARSDVDFLVEFAYASDRGSLADYFGLQRDLEKLLGRSVDLVSGHIRNPFMRQSIDESREPLYAA